MFVLRNSFSEQRLLIKTLALVWGIRLGLWILPFSALSDVVARISAGSPLDSAGPQQNLQLAKRISSAVRRASRYVPAASCLTKAMATQVLLSRRGQISNLIIGVNKNPEGVLGAHAWVESNGKIIMGWRSDLRSYTILRRLGEISQ
jgi:hypothetical protein